MKCLSCRAEMQGPEAKLFKSKILICGPCHALAESAARDVDAAFHRARATADQMLLEHVMAGRLLQGGTGAQGVEVTVTQAN
jgi:hypothetical protein